MLGEKAPSPIFTKTDPTNCCTVYRKTKLLDLAVKLQQSDIDQWLTDSVIRDGKFGFKPVG